MYGYFKRAIDLVVALVLCIVLAPLLVVVALAIRSESSGPALLRQQRRGKNMRPFTFVKFRSLRHEVPDLHANYERSRRTRGSRGSGRSCAAPAWTSCPSCSTCSPAR